MSAYRRKRALLLGIPVCLGACLIGAVLLASHPKLEAAGWIFLCFASLPTGLVMAWHVHAIEAIASSLVIASLAGAFAYAVLKGGGGGLAFLEFALLPLLIGAVVGAFAGLFTRSWFRG